MSCNCKNQLKDAVQAGRFRSANQRAHVIGCDDAETLTNKGPEGSLETTAKYVGQIAGRKARFRHQRHAAKLMDGMGRVGLCRWSVVSKSAGVDIVTSHYGDDPTRHAHYEGLQTCGSVWACPCCSARISETRREELGRLLSWARTSGYKVRMLTLTARHGRDDDLADLMLRLKGRAKNAKTGESAFRGAKQRLVQHRSYKAIKGQIVGSVTATEVTGGGAHGWHPHMHMILILREDIDFDRLRDAWLASLRGAGLDGTGQGWDVREADETGQYLAKWGAAEELALTRHKRGRSGRTPAQLLAAACDDGDGLAGRLWAEYARVFHGRRQLVWSDGLKALAGIDEVKDEEAAKDEGQENQVEDGRAKITHADWRKVAAKAADRRAELLELAEDEGADAAAKAAEDFDVQDPDTEPPSFAERGQLMGELLEEIEEAERGRRNADVRGWAEPSRERSLFRASNARR